METERIVNVKIRVTMFDGDTEKLVEHGLEQEISCASNFPEVLSFEWEAELT